MKNGRLLHFRKENGTIRKRKYLFELATYSLRLQQKKKERETKDKYAPGPEIIIKVKSYARVRILKSLN